MELPDSKYEEIEEYLLGTLPPEKRRSLEKEMETDENLKKEFELHQQIFKDTQSLHQQQRIQNLAKEVLEESSEVKPRALWNKQRIIMVSLAAALAILFLFFFSIPNQFSFQLLKPQAISLEEQISEAKKQFRTAGRVLKIEEVLGVSDDSIDWALGIIEVRLDSFPLDKNYRLVGGLLRMKKGEKALAINNWEEIFLNNEFSCVERYDFAKLIFWNLYEPFDKEGLLRFHDQWKEIENCPELANFSAEEKKEKDDILWVLSYMDKL